MSNDEIIEKLGYCRIAVAYDRSKVDAIDNAIDIIDSLDRFLMDLKKYELDCALTADGQCSKCNETLFQSIYSMMEKHFGKFDDWHNTKKG
jgi:hypothetical protein